MKATKHTRHEIDLGGPLVLCDHGAPSGECIWPGCHHCPVSREEAAVNEE